MPIFGINNGMIPIVAYNLGARKKERIFEVIKFAIILAVSIMFIGLIVFELIPETLLLLFNASDELLRLGIPALRIIAIHFPIAGYCIIINAVFQAMGKGTYSLINSIIRQVAILLPCAYFLSLTGNINLVWLAFPIAEAASAISSSILFKKSIKHINTF